MADNNLQDMTTTWVTMGFLILSMIIFSGQFIDNNSPGALGDVEGVFADVENNLTSNLVEVDTEANNQIDISSLVSSENSQQGLFVSSSNSYGFFGVAIKFFKASFRLIYYVLPEPFASILVAMFSGLLIFSGLFYIIKLGRSFF